MGICRFSVTISSTRVIDINGYFNMRISNIFSPTDLQYIAPDSIRAVLDGIHGTSNRWVFFFDADDYKNTLDITADILPSQYLDRLVIKDDGVY